MFIKNFTLWSIFTILTSVHGKWGLGRVFKPNGLNTIFLNECMARRSVFRNQHLNTEGEQMARLLGEVSTSVTSRAIMDIIRLANGHSPVSCSQAELEEMETEYESCVNRRQYKLKCFNLSKDQQCQTINEFLEECTKGVLGQCFGSEFSWYISSVQHWSLSSSKVSRRTGLQDTCFTPTTHKIPHITDFVTETPIVMDRTKPLRRYLRHPAFSN